MDVATLRSQALAALGQREYSRKDLFRKLTHGGGDTALVDEVLDECVRLGYLDDQRYAVAFTRKRVRQGYGPRIIRSELLQSGIVSEQAREVLDAGEHDWAALAAKLYHKKFGAKPASDLKEKARRARFLFAKGFSSDHIQSLLKGIDMSWGEDDEV